MTTIGRRSLLVGLATAFPLIPAAGFAQGARPPNEVGMQKLLPKSADPLWGKFAQCKLSYNEETGIYRIAMTKDVRQLNGKTISLKGFVMPLDGSDRTKHFLLTRNTPVCLYCPPGEPNEVVEIIATRPVPWSEAMKTVTGTLRLINDAEQALFFKIETAQVGP